MRRDSGWPANSITFPAMSILSSSCCITRLTPIPRKRFWGGGHSARAREQALAKMLEERQLKTRPHFIVFSGHVHNYERYEHHGVTYIVTGGGGATPYSGPARARGWIPATRPHLPLLRGARERHKTRARHDETRNAKRAAAFRSRRLGGHHQRARAARQSRLGQIAFRWQP